MITGVPEIDYTIIHNKPFVSGLKNIGNTCYMNSCLKILYYKYELTQCLEELDIKYNSDIPETIVLVEWMEIKNILWDKKCTISPFKCIAGLRHVAKIKDNDMFTDGQQNDICEFLLFMLDCFHTSICKPIHMDYQEYLTSMNINHSIISDKCFKLLQSSYFKHYSDVSNLFYGIQINTIQQQSDLSILSINPEIISIIHLDIPENILQPTLHDCIDLYCNHVLFENENAYFNESKNEYVSALKSSLFWKLPHILIFTFNRTKINGRGKNNTLIHFPVQNLDMSKYLILQNNVYEYELYGVGCHNGGIMGGHYTACVKHNDKWYHCNDDKITQLHNPLQLINPNVYCLFYRKTFSSV